MRSPQGDASPPTIEEEEGKPEEKKERQKGMSQLAARLFCQTPSFLVCKGRGGEGERAGGTLRDIASAVRGNRRPGLSEHRRGGVSWKQRAGKKRRPGEKLMRHALHSWGGRPISFLREGGSE